MTLFFLWSDTKPKCYETLFFNWSSVLLLGLDKVYQKILTWGDIKRSDEEILNRFLKRV
jgi:hypothetical protein